MKFKHLFADDLDERFTSDYSRDAHYDKHVVKNKEQKCSVDDYEKQAEVLMKTPANNKHIFGYISETREGKTAYCKYNKDTEDFVVYTYRGIEPLTITYYKKSWREFQGDKAIEYFGEIPTGK